jgi:hypothetical protein
MDIRGKKNKGNRAVKKVIEYFNIYLGIDKSFLYSTASSVKGRDITLDKSISKLYPFSIEVKNQETINFSNWWLQVLSNTEESLEIPVLIFTRNRDILRVAFKYSDFFSYYTVTDTSLATKEVSYEVTNVKVPTWKCIMDTSVYSTFINNELIVIMPFNIFLEDYKKWKLN